MQALGAGPYDPIPLASATTDVDGSAVLRFLHTATGMPQALVAAILPVVVAIDLAALLTVLIVGIRRRGPRSGRPTAHRPAV